MNRCPRKTKHRDTCLKKRQSLVPVALSLFRKSVPIVSIAENSGIPFVDEKIGYSDSKQRNLRTELNVQFFELCGNHPFNVRVAILDAMNRPPKSCASSAAESRPRTWLARLKWFFAQFAHAVYLPIASSGNAEFTAVLFAFRLSGDCCCYLSNVLFGFDVVLLAVYRSLPFDECFAAWKCTWMRWRWHGCRPPSSHMLPQESR